MSVVKINAITVPKDKQDRFEERFRGRAGAVESTPGFEWFDLLRPLEGTDQYLVYTGTPSVNVREEVRLSLSVSVMAPTCVCADSGSRRPPVPGSHYPRLRRRP